MKKFLSAAMAAVILLSALCVNALAASDKACAVVGADLTNFQTEGIYAEFGVRRGEVRELSISVEEEREYLRGTLSDDVIGEAAYSCVYIRLLPEGEGTKVSLHNITWCTEEMYRVALSAAGIHDVEAVIAAPFDDSGAAALAGIYKAYELLTDKTLDQKARDLGAQILSLGSQLSEQLGKIDFSGLLDELEQRQSEIRGMTDQELSDKIRSVAAEHNITLNDGQVQMLLELCRGWESSGSADPTDRPDDAQDTAQKLEDLEEKAQRIGAAAEKVRDFFIDAYEFLSDLLGK